MDVFTSTVTPGSATETFSDNLTRLLLDNIDLELRKEDDLHQTSPDRQRIKTALIELDKSKTHEMSRLRSFQQFLLMAKYQLLDLRIYPCLKDPTTDAAIQIYHSQASAKLHEMMDKVNQTLGRIATEIRLLENIYIPPYISCDLQQLHVKTTETPTPRVAEDHNNSCGPQHAAPDLSSSVASQQVDNQWQLDLKTPTLVQNESHHLPVAPLTNFQADNEQSSEARTLVPHVAKGRATPRPARVKEINRAVRKLTQQLLGIRIDNGISETIREGQFITLEASTAYSNHGNEAPQLKLEPFCPCWEDLSASWNMDLEGLFVERFKSEHPVLGVHESHIRQRFRKRLNTLCRKIEKDNLMAASP